MTESESSPSSPSSTGEPQPEASRPHIPGYGIPTDTDGLLPWSHVVERLESAENYWVGTTDRDGEPHATPVWGVWVAGSLYFDGSPETRRGRNLAHNPAVAVHLESGSDVVIIRGVADQLRGPNRNLAHRLAAAYAAKYAEQGYQPAPDTWDEGGLYVVRPREAFAWTQFPTDATRWRFDTG